MAVTLFLTQHRLNTWLWAILLSSAVFSSTLFSTYVSASTALTSENHHSPPAKRIVSLAPHITELLFAIGAGDQVIATDEASDYPLAAQALPKVANYRSLNTERILSLAPDLIVAWGSAQQQAVQPFVQLGIPVFLSAPANFNALSTELRQLGELTGQQANADNVIRAYEQKLAELKEQYQHLTPLTVFYQIAEAPLMSANGSTWMSQAVTLCGGINIMADSLAPYPQVNAEQVLAKDPDVIVASDPGALNHWQQWPQLSAVANQQLISVEANLLHRFTPRSMEGIQQLCQQFAAIRQSHPAD